MKLKFWLFEMYEQILENMVCFCDMGRANLSWNF